MPLDWMRRESRVLDLERKVNTNVKIQCSHQHGISLLLLRGRASKVAPTHARRTCAGKPTNQVLPLSSGSNVAISVFDQTHWGTRQDNRLRDTQRRRAIAPSRLVETSWDHIYVHANQNGKHRPPGEALGPHRSYLATLFLHELVEEPGRGNVKIHVKMKP